MGLTELAHSWHRHSYTICAPRMRPWGSLAMRGFMLSYAPHYVGEERFECIDR